MFPNMIVHFLYEEQRRKDEIRQIQLENEYHRALRNGAVAHRWNLRSLRSRYQSLVTRLLAMSGQKIQESGSETGSPNPCPEPCFAS